MIKDKKRCVKKTNEREKGEIEQVTREEQNGEQRSKRRRKGWRIRNERKKKMRKEDK